VGRVPGRTALVSLLQRESEAVTVVEDGEPADPKPELEVALAGDGSAIEVRRPDPAEPVVAQLLLTGPPAPDALAELVSDIRRVADWLHLERLANADPASPLAAGVTIDVQLPLGTSRAPAGSPDHYDIIDPNGTAAPLVVVRNDSAKRLFIQARLLEQGYRSVPLGTPSRIGPIQFPSVEPGGELFLGTEWEWQRGRESGSDQPLVRATLRAKVAFAEAPFVLPEQAGAKEIDLPPLGHDPRVQWGVRDLTATLLHRGRPRALSRW
jgi:hypothetical protein